MLIKQVKKQIHLHILCSCVVTRKTKRLKKAVHRHVKDAYEQQQRKKANSCQNIVPNKIIKPANFFPGSIIGFITACIADLLLKWYIITKYRTSLYKVFLFVYIIQFIYSISTMKY